MNRGKLERWHTGGGIDERKWMEETTTQAPFPSSTLPPRPGSPAASSTNWMRRADVVLHPRRVHWNECVNLDLAQEQTAMLGHTAQWRV